MTVGTTTNLNDSRLEIISDALMLLGVTEAGETVSESDMQLGVRWLNRMVKQWQAKGIEVWTNSYATLFLEMDTSLYILGNEAQGGAMWAEDPIEQLLTEDADLGDTILNVESSSDITIGDHFGIIDNDGILEWFLVADKPTTTSVTINSPLLADCNSDNYIYSFSNRPESGAPLRIINANLKSNMDQQTSEIIMPGIAFQDWFQLTNKQGPGNPVNWNYSPKINTGEMRLWPTPNNMTQRVGLQYTRPMFNFDTATSTQDMQQEWITAIIYNLAVILAPSYGKSSLLPTLKVMADEYLEEAESYSQETISIYFNPTNERW